MESEDEKANNGGPSEDITLIGGSGPNGSISLTFDVGNWDVPQTVVFKAIDDDIAEPNDQPQLFEEHTIHLVSSYPGHPTDANFVGEKSITVTVVDNDLPPGETLYNGIVLPYGFPLSAEDEGREPGEPMPVPYLDNPPDLIPIDVGRQLFVDDFLIETTTLARTYYTAEYYTNNPVLKPDQDWEFDNDNWFAAPFSGGSWYDSKDNLFKMWYTAGFLMNSALATSEDGIHWNKPIYDVTGDSSIVLPADWLVTEPRAIDSTSIFIDDKETDSSKRYKYFATEEGHGGPRFHMAYRTSADGIHWSNPADALHAIDGDRSTVFYNPFRQVWVLSERADWGSIGRARKYCDNTNIVQLIEEYLGNEDKRVFWVTADYLDPRNPYPEWGDEDPELYNLDATPYESLMIGMFSIWTAGGGGDVQKRNDVLLGFSRDGFHWDRPDRRRFFSSTYDDASWRFGNVQSCIGTPLVVGDQLYFYFSGRAHITAGLYNRDGMNSDFWDADAATGLAMLRRDGFASMDADAGGGTLTTRPVTFNGKYLFVNVDCPAGELKVEVLDENSQVIAPFTLANCDAISSDTTRTQVTWGANDALTALIGQPIRFRFSLTDCSLYAFWVSPDKTGASYGYVGGGGPGFTGPTDTVGQPECAAVNLDDDSEINTADLAIIAAHWLFDCTAPDWCGGSDLNPIIDDRGRVNLVDFANLALYWLETNCI